MTLLSLVQKPKNPTPKLPLIDQQFSNFFKTNINFRKRKPKTKQKKFNWKLLTKKTPRYHYTIKKLKKKSVIRHFLDSDSDEDW